MGEAEVGFRIQALEDTSHLRACVALQRQVWKFEDHDLVSISMLEAAGTRRGTLLGAVSDSGQIQGFVFGFPAWWNGVAVEHSHMLAVVGEARDSGVGRALKLAQRDAVVARGIETITWTFDPLESKNAHLNINRLGARVRRYYQDLYGTTTSSDLHSGLGTDRLLAEWDVTREPPNMPAGPGEDVTAVVGLSEDSHGLPRVLESEFVEEDCVEIALPSNIQELKAVDLGLARQWRAVTRKALCHYFDAGYEVVRLAVTRDEQGTRRAAYQLEMVKNNATERSVL